VIYDDLGVAEPTAAYLEKMLFWLDSVDKDKKTIITTNLSLEQIKKKDGRIYSRILKNCKVIELT
jgi:DNA replication protein DnaC